MNLMFVIFRLNNFHNIFLSVIAEGNGKCTFCGHYVCLTTDRSKADEQSSQRASGMEDEVAVALKNRLVEYDRSAAK